MTISLDRLNHDRPRQTKSSVRRRGLHFPACGSYSDIWTQTSPRKPSFPQSFGMSTTLVDVLRAQAEESAGELAFLFLIDGETEGPRYSYAQLDAQRGPSRWPCGASPRAGAGAAGLSAGLDFVAAFFGCLYAGVIAVPVYPPRPDFLRPGTQPLAAFAADCQPAVVLGTAEMLAELRSTLAGSPALAQAHAIATDELEPTSARPGGRRPSPTNGWPCCSTRPVRRARRGA